MQQQRPGTPVQSGGTSLVKMLPTTVQQGGMTQTTTGGQKVVVMSLPQSVPGSQPLQQVQGTSGDVGMKSVFTSADQAQAQVSLLKSEPNT